MKTFLLSIFCGMVLFANSQSPSTGVGVGTTTPNSSSVLDVSSSNKGMLMPRMTTDQRKAISNPATGLLVFDTDKGTIMFFDGVNWKAMAFADESKTDPLSRNSTQPLASAGFGSKVSISGDYAIIGAPRYGTQFSYMGVAYIFNRTSSGWKQVARLAPYDSSASAYFGGAVAISGDYAIVGAANKTVNGNNSQGRAYVYHRVGAAWNLDTALVKPGGAAFEDFGWAVGVCAFNTGGPAITIGIPYSDAGGTDKGEIFCYKKTGTSWAFVQNIVPTDLGPADYYGSTIAMDTDYVAVGATGQDNATYSYVDAGAVYLYAYGGGAWNFQQKLQGTTAKSQFGFALSLSGNRLAVGAPWATTYSNTSSSVSIYQRTGSSWANTAGFFIYNFEIIAGAGQIQPVTGTTSISIANITFGISLSLSGNTLLVGSSGGTDYPNGGSSYYSDRVGTVYVYKNLSGNTFTRTDIIQSDFPSAGDLFGESVGISGNNYLIANPHAIVNGLVNAGTVYFGNEAN